MDLTHNYSRKGAFRDIATIVRQRNNFKPKIIAFIIYRSSKLIINNSNI